VRIDEATGTAEVIVPDYQLSLAIGKEGQNARLAARLTGWRVDIKSETQLAEEEAYANQDWAEGEWVENEAGEMVWKPAEGGEGLTAEAWSHGDEVADGKSDEVADGQSDEVADGQSDEVAEVKSDEVAEVKNGEAAASPEVGPTADSGSEGVAEAVTADAAPSDVPATDSEGTA
jgi:transcription termination/antitermination protein NusA